MSLRASLSSLLAQAPPGPDAGAPEAAAEVVAESGQGLQATLDHTLPVDLATGVLLLLLAATGAAVLILLAYRGEQPSGVARPWRTKAGLALLRWTALVLALVLIFGWVRRPFRTDLPDLVVLLDVSASMAVEDAAADPSQLDAVRERARAAGLSGASRLDLARTLLLEDDAALWRELEQRYHVRLHLVGAAARPLPEDRPPAESLRELTADQPASRLGKCLLDALEAQRGRPTAAVLILTDGATTEGQSLGEAAGVARRKAIPLYVVGLGNERPPRDLALSDLTAEEVVFVGDACPFDVLLTGQGAAGTKVRVQLRRVGDDRELDEREAVLGADGQPQPVRLVDRPTELGVHEYEVSVAPLDGEINRDNNRAVRLVDVRDETLRVLLVQDYPNYEFRYLKSLLSRQRKLGGAGDEEKSIELTTVLQEADPEYADTPGSGAERVFPVSREELFAYDVIVFGDVNPAFLSASQLDHLAAFVRERGGGLAVLAGPRHTPLAYRGTPLEELLPLRLDAAALPDPQQTLRQPIRVRPTPLGLSTAALQLGDDPPASARIWQELPPLYWLLEAPELKPGVRVLAVDPDRSGRDGQPLPAICLHYVGAGKVLFHATDETWRWRYRTGDRWFGRYWLQMLRSLARSRLLGGARGVEVTTDRETYRRGDPVRLRVRFLDDRLAPAEDDGVAVVIESERAQRRNVRLERNDAERGVFTARVGDLGEGSYRAWLATPTLEGPPPARRFTVTSPPGEQTRLEMDAADLRRAAQTSQGKFYTLASAGELLDDLPAGRQVRIATLSPQPVWNAWTLAALFVGLLAAEWFLRKRVGLL